MHRFVIALCCWATSLCAIASDVGVYIINMNDSEERAAKIFPLAQQMSYPVYRIEAVNGRLLSERDLENYQEKGAMRKRWPRSSMRPAEVGCSLSHIKAWKQFLDHDHEYALIFEDDTEFSPKQLEHIIEDLLRYKAYWDVCSLQGRYYRKRFALPIFSLGDHDLSMPYKSLYCAGAYVVSRKAAKAYLKDALPLQMPVDHYLYRDFPRGLLLMLVTPMPTDQDGVSEIDKNEKRGMQKDKELYYRIHRELFRMGNTFFLGCSWGRLGYRLCKEAILSFKETIWSYFSGLFSKK